MYKTHICINREPALFDIESNEETLLDWIPHLVLRAWFLLFRDAVQSNKIDSDLNLQPFVYMQRKTFYLIVLVLRIQRRALTPHQMMGYSFFF
jgi:hypothetical protein